MMLHFIDVSDVPLNSNQKNKLFTKDLKLRLDKDRLLNMFLGMREYVAKNDMRVYC